MAIDRDFIKGRVREMIEKEKKGEVVEREVEKDPLEIPEDSNEENLMSEIVTDEERSGGPEDLTEDSKSAPERKDTTDVSLAEDVEIPAPSKAEVETESEVGPVDTETKGEKSKAEAPVDSGTKYKVKTVYGDEELSLKELEDGYMRAAHHTQVSQQNAEMRKQLNYLFSDPKNIVEYAIANGVDLRALVQAEMVVPEFNVPEPGEYADDSIKANYAYMKKMWEVNQALLKEVSGIKGNIKASRIGTTEDQIEREFKERRGVDVPETAIHAVRALFMEGKRIYGKNYGMHNALRDYKLAEGDIVARWKLSTDYQKWSEVEKRKIIKEYADGKSNDKDATLSPDSLPTGKRPVPPERTPKPRTIAEGLAMAKKKYFGGK
jgi:hypothetical protein